MVLRWAPSHVRLVGSGPAPRVKARTPLRDMP